MRRWAAIILITALAATGCASSAARSRGREDVLRLGIFPNLTHAPGLVAIASGILEDALAPARVDVSVFNSGGDAGTALLGGSLDATYIGPGPTASLFLKSGNVAVVSGAVSGGASLVVRTGSGIDGPEDLAGKKVAVPGIGNTQDIALRTWLHEHGLEARDESGDVAILAVDNPDLPQVFRSGDVDAAWEPEPWPSLLEAEGLATELFDERTLWPEGDFVTTNLLVSSIYMDAHPEVVRSLVEANVEALRLIRDDPERAKRLAVEQLVEAGGARPSDDVLDNAWDRMEFTWDPVAESLRANAERAHELEVIEEDPAPILDVYRLDDLNATLEEFGEDPVEEPR